MVNSTVKQNISFLLCFLCIWACAAAEGQNTVDPQKQGGLKGDVELLRQTAIAHRENSEGIRTWQGKAQVEQVHEDANGIRFQRKSSVEFLFNRELNATRWRWTTEEYRVRKDGRLVFDPNMATIVDAMMRGNAFYRYAPGITTREGKRHNTLVIWPAERARKAAYSDSFDPMWYLTESKYDLVEKLLFHYREANNPELIPGTVRRDGDLVILETKGSVALNRHEFDLSKGGNLVRYYAESSRAVEDRTLAYEEKGGVWVPKTFVFSLGNGAADGKIERRSRKVTFVENIVNSPIDSSQFSLKILGLKYGDRVTDQRANTAYTYNEAEEQKLIQELQSLSTLPRKDGLLIPEFMEPLVDKPLPSLDGLDTKFCTKAAEAKNILICFWDMNQRPSRHLVKELAKKANDLKEKPVVVVCVQALKVKRAELDEWVKENNIQFEVGMIEGDVKKVRFKWGVRSLPWLILTDSNHIVRAEGLTIGQLNEEIKEAGYAKP